MQTYNGRTSIGTLLESNFPFYWCFCLKYAGMRYRHMEAEDLAGDAILKALRSKKMIDPRGIFKFLKQAIDWIAISNWRRRKIKTSPLEGDFVDYVQASNAAFKEVEAAIAMLPPKQRAVMEMTSRGYSSDEIAFELCITTAAVRARLRAAWRRIMRTLAS
ncbi:MAG: sigma-70 family RNA polymerase sigma factor [Planctomycetaceae bacterium]|nr:sigma-70 family RNA polymerase sigma factor [Planctomycetaceae bacterium]